MVMKHALLGLWQDDGGIVSLEYLQLATVVGLGLVVGLSALNAALTSEYTELSNAILALDQSYSYVGFKVTNHRGGSLASHNGTATTDHYNRNNAVAFTGRAVDINVIP
jgi:Flp pilus assembly pilin Flp